MRKFAVIVGLSFAAIAAQAQTFTTVQFQNTLGATAAFTATGNTYRADLTGFDLNANAPIGDVVWIFDFDSTPVPAFTSVKIRIGGTIAGGTIALAGNEKVFDTSGTTPVQVADGLINGQFSGTGPVSFLYEDTFTFSQPVTLGQAQKDILNVLITNGATANVAFIEQEFTPVPEPASMAALGLGLALVARRRRRK